MYQQEIQFFWPLTEQIDLDLDFKPCLDYQEEQRKLWASSALSGHYLIAGGGLGATSWSTVTSNQSLAGMMEFRASPDSVGYWEVSPSLRYYVTQEPNWIVKKMSKFLLGWKWGKN